MGALNPCPHVPTRPQTKTMGIPGEGAAMGKGVGPLGLSQANFGPKYEQHVAQLQRSLEEANKRLEELQRSEDALRCGGRGAGP